MGDPLDRRARKKAQTRAQIVCMAHALFARHGFESVTIADVAAAADVAVQTVFNHFASKEELFFDGRTAWLPGAADAVRHRPPHVDPLRALHEFSIRLVQEMVRSAHTPKQREIVQALASSPALARYHLALQQKAEGLLTEALIEAWTAAPSTAPCRGAADQVELRMAAALVSALTAGGVRAVLTSLRDVASGDGDADRVHAAVERLAELVLDRIENGLGPLLRRQEWAAVQGRPVEPTDRLTA